MSSTQVSIETGVQETYKKLLDGVNKVTQTEEWQRFMSFQSQFWRYSFPNTLLIYLQRPDASYVAGFNGWKRMGRYVMKGEKALKIFAPCHKKIKGDKDELTGEHKAILILKGFKLVNVFDLAQTDGDDTRLPVLVRGLDGDHEEADTIYQSLKQIIGIPVTENSALQAKGTYFPGEQRIEINTRYSPVQRLKTLIHEFSHHIHMTQYWDKEGRGQSEAIAESVAYIVSSYIGLDVADYSLGYIHSWAGESRALLALGGKINVISAKIIQLIEGRVKQALFSFENGWEGGENGEMSISW